jgi:hypothetical protein
MTTTDIALKERALRDWGFIIGPRDPRLNTNYKGRFMVVEEEYEDMRLPTRNGSNGPWCIVGNDLNALIGRAYDVWVSVYEPVTDKHISRPRKARAGAHPP